MFDLSASRFRRTRQRHLLGDGVAGHRNRQRRAPGVVLGDPLGHVAALGPESFRRRRNAARSNRLA
ncbi:MAG: hypothetical protein M3Y41_18395 [Pseudomonadota bacterium]|nr:hypothetical protein [Pseudomonadota bacterium]